MLLPTNIYFIETVINNRTRKNDKFRHKLVVFSFIRLRRVILLRSFIVLCTVLFATRVYRRIKYH